MGENASARAHQPCTERRRRVSAVDAWPDEPRPRRHAPGALTATCRCAARSAGGTAWTPEQVFPVSGGTSFANWFACAAPLNGAPRGSEVIVERPTYEPLLKIPQVLGYRVRRLDRRFDEDFRIDLDRFAALVNRRTRLAIVSNLHNPSGARIDLRTLRRMAAILARVGAYLVVDEVYLECFWGRRTRILRPCRSQCDHDEQPDEGLRPRRPARGLGARPAHDDPPRRGRSRICSRTTASRPANR